MLKDGAGISVRKERFSSSGRDMVNAQIQEWLRDGIVQHSLLEYASLGSAGEERRRVSEALCKIIVC